MDYNKEDTIFIDSEKRFSFLEALYAYKQTDPPKFLKAATIEGGLSLATLVGMIAHLDAGYVIIPSVNKLSDDVLGMLDIDYRLIANGESIKIEFWTLMNHTKVVRYPALGANPGIIFLTSGTTGKPKIVLHDFTKLALRYQKKRPKYITGAFLPHDHIGGFDVLMHALNSGSTIVNLPDKSVPAVLSAVEEHKIELLPVPPSFINRAIITGEIYKYDLSSLKIIAYGSEKMYDEVLKTLHRILPSVKLKQTYGITEFGTFPTSSKADDSTWMRLGIPWRTDKDGRLWIKPDAPMVTYLDREDQPNTLDGYYFTGDLAEQDGDYIRILGREKNVINVGGEKVNAEEIEEFIRGLIGVADVRVDAEENAVLGQVVKATVVSSLQTKDKAWFVEYIKGSCASGLDRYKVPAKVIVTDELDYTDRFKKRRTL